MIDDIKEKARLKRIAFESAGYVVGEIVCDDMSCKFDSTDAFGNKRSHVYSSDSVAVKPKKETPIVANDVAEEVIEIKLAETPPKAQKKTRKKVSK